MFSLLEHSAPDIPMASSVSSLRSQLREALPDHSLTKVGLHPPGMLYITRFHCFRALLLFEIIFFIYYMFIVCFPIAEYKPQEGRD